MSASHATGFSDRHVLVPCCGASTELDRLDHAWPAGFARLEMAVRDPDRTWLTVEEPAEVGSLLGHPVRQVVALY